MNNVLKLNQLGDQQHLKKADFEIKIYWALIKTKIKKFKHILTMNVLIMSSVFQTMKIIQGELPIVIIQSKNVYDMPCKNYKETPEDVNNQIVNCPDVTSKPIEIDISFREVPAPSGTNYVNTKQNSELWHITRNKKITGLRLGSLIGLHSGKKFTGDCENWKKRKRYLGH